MIRPDDKLTDVLHRNIDLLPIVFRFGISQNIGQHSIMELCRERNINMAFFLSIMNTYDSPDFFPESENVDLKMLTDFLRKTHDYHKDVTIPRLRNLLGDLKLNIPGTKLAFILENYLNSYIDKLLLHIMFEEENIFPLVDSAEQGNTAFSSGESLTRLEDIFSQHTNVETELSDLITIILQHIPDDSDALLFHEILHTLTHFEKEQVDHARFEDKILVPRLLKQITSG